MIPILRRSHLQRDRCRHMVRQTVSTTRTPPTKSTKFDSVTSSCDASFFELLVLCHCFGVFAEAVASHQRSLCSSAKLDGRPSSFGTGGKFVVVVCSLHDLQWQEAASKKDRFVFEDSHAGKPQKWLLTKRSIVIGDNLNRTIFGLTNECDADRSHHLAHRVPYGSCR